MTITVTPAAVVKTAATTQTDATQNGGGDLFASLLGMQIGNLVNLTQGNGGNAGQNASQGQQDKAASKDDTTPAAPVDAMAVLLLQSLPATPVAPVAVKPAGLDTAQQVQASVDTVKNTELDSLLAAQVDTKKLAHAGQNLPQAGDAAQFLPVLDQAAAASAQAGQTQQAAQTQTVPTLTIQQPVTDPAWSKSLGDQMMSMVNLKMDKATIQVNPPQLGPVEVTLKMNGNDQAQVIFTAAVPATREILENNMPKLASMMAANGIALADAQVSSGQSGNRQQQFAQSQNGRRASDSSSEEDDTLASIKAARGILSIFA